MTILAYYTRSHRELFEEHFLPSLPDEPGLELISYESKDQHCASAEIHSPGWNRAMLGRIEFVRKHVDAMRTHSLFVVSDVDVQFFGPIIEDLTVQLGTHDIAFQRDSQGGRKCAGFYVARVNRKTKNLFARVHYRLSKMKPEPGKGEQFVMNAAIKRPRIRYKLLDDRYWTHGIEFGTWEPGERIDVPNDILMHHANWTHGTENKKALLTYVQSCINNRDIQRREIHSRLHRRPYAANAV